ncbi:tellurite resistance protein [Shimia gijangensis]|uniref:Tellurite resistance protein n=1 Tax=Shimia gijangensis TaxID=1470563 RepID=A0A1M6HSN9_9RHOB|nr:hypothetical protein [Shimia gijangensis]SHJ25219.1 tellurite resistance protein [Shimia gijangensis]
MHIARPLWRRTPPAVFPICLALLGLGLGWRNASEVLPLAHEIGDLFLGCASAFFLYFLVVYTAKVVARPAVILEDMQSAPARAGIAAAAMAMMLLAAALIPLGLSVPQVWWTGVGMQVVASGLGCWAIWLDPPEKRNFSTFQYLTFVGPVVGPIAGLQLGYVWESVALIYAALVAYVVITIGLLFTIRPLQMPVVLRPSLAIFLAPNCLFGIGFGLLGHEIGFLVFYWFATAIAVLLLVISPWMIKRPWTPVWGSLSFPVAAFLQLQVMGLSRGFGVIAEVSVYGALAIGTPLISGLAYMTILTWVTGELAEKSGAARA